MTTKRMDQKPGETPKTRILSPLCLPFHHDGDVVLGREVAANELPVANLGTRRLVPPRTRPSCLKEGKDRMRRMNRIHALPPPSRQHTSGENPDLHNHDSHDKNAQRLSSPLLPSLPSLLKTLPLPILSIPFILSKTAPLIPSPSPDATAPPSEPFPPQPTPFASRRAAGIAEVLDLYPPKAAPVLTTDFTDFTDERGWNGGFRLGPC